MRHRHLIALLVLAAGLVVALAGCAADSSSQSRTVDGQPRLNTGGGGGAGGGGAATQPTNVEQSAVTGGGRLFPQDTPQRVLAVTDRVFPAVVRLDVAQEVYREGKRTFQRGTGSGVIFDEQGHILTNFHVAGRASELWVTLANKERVRGHLIGSDHWTDLAVVRLDMDEVRNKGIEFAHAQLAEDETLVPGQDVIAIGTPFGLARTMSKGVVSNIERTFYPGKSDIDGYETGLFNNWIQMDAPIAPGNSGGPLVDLNARVVGINTRGMVGSDLNFAIPIGTVRAVKDAILADYERQAAEASQASAEAEPRGKVNRADLGMDLKPLQDLETFYNIDPNRGVLIDNVARGGPAAQAGLRVQDILLAIGDEPANVRFPEELAAVRHRIATLPLDQPVTLRIQRGNQEQTLEATPTKLESAVGEERELEGWGLSIRDVTRPYANAELLDDDKGVVVTTVRPGYPAAKAELGPGDVIKQVAGQPAEDLEAFMKLYTASIEARQSPVLLTVARRQGTRTVLLKLN